MVCSPAQSATTGYRPEWELLLCCARSRLDDRSSQRVQDLVRNEVDWDRLIELAGKHHVLPLVYLSLFTVCPDGVPPAKLEQLQKMFTLNGARNRVLTGELIGLLKLLAAHGISAIPYKGPTLASLAYGGLALRQAGDLDVLVYKRDAKKTRDLLISRGFRPYLERTCEQESIYSHHFMMVRDQRPLTVEIHWQLIDTCLCFGLDEADLMRNASSTRLAGVDVACFPMPELIVYLCAHGAKHCWERLSWICDIAELSRFQPNIDWDLVMRKARAIGAERMVSVGLLLASDLLGAPISPAIARRIRADGMAKQLVREVVERHLRDPDSPPAFAEWWRFNVRARERRRDRLRCRLKLVAPAFLPNERDLAFLRLPPGLAFLYHGVKPVRLAARYAPHPSRFLRVIGDLIASR